MNKTAKKVMKKASSRPRSSARGPVDVKRKLEVALRSEFPQDTVDVSDGYKGNVHVLVVSRRFDGMSEYERQGLLRSVVEGTQLTAPQKAKITLLLALSPAEIK